MKEYVLLLRQINISYITVENCCCIRTHHMITDTDVA